MTDYVERMSYKNHQGPFRSNGKGCAGKVCEALADLTVENGRDHIVSFNNTLKTLASFYSNSFKNFVCAPGPFFV